MGRKVELPEPQPIQTPRIRLPTAFGAQQLGRERVGAEAAQRGGRQSTILSNALRSLTGSIGFLGR